jgi:hypothetical protein
MSTMNYILGRPDDDDKKRAGQQAQPSTAGEAQPFLGTTMTEENMAAVGEQVDQGNQRQEGQLTAKEAQEAKAATTKVGGSIDGLVPPVSSPSAVAQAAEAKVSAATPSAIRNDVDKATQMKNYRDVLNYLQGGVESKEAREKREKREARERKFAALSDALGAMHRAYTHSRGIEAMKLPQNAYEETLRRQQMLKQHRDQNAQAYTTAYERMQQSKRAEDAAKLEREYRERKLEYDRMNAESLRDYRREQGRLAGERTTAYVYDKQNQSDNRTSDTTSKIEHRRNMDNTAAIRAANAGNKGGGGSSSRGGGKGGTYKPANDPNMEQVTVTGYDEQGNKFTRKGYQPRGGSGKGSSGGGRGNTPPSRRNGGSTPPSRRNGNGSSNTPPSRRK